MCADWTDWVIEKRRAHHRPTVLMQYVQHGAARFDLCDGVTSCQSCGTIYRGLCQRGFHVAMLTHICASLMYRCGRTLEDEDGYRRGWEADRMWSAAWRKEHEGVVTRA